MGRLALEAYWLRRQGQSDQSVLIEASTLKRNKSGKRSFASSDTSIYHVAECLRKNGDARCRRYFQQSLRATPFNAKVWFRLFLSWCMEA
jgi:hypothetical protein